MRGLLSCQCAVCKAKGIHKMTKQEINNYLKYLIQGRSMGNILDIFPDIPGWIAVGSIEPLMYDKTMCPKCEAKNKR